MREFSHNQSFHDTDGNLLHGMVAFYKKNTSDLQNIYNSDGEVLSNPIFTDSIGQTKHQVFLDDTDYTVAFYKYIGEGDIETADVNDTSKWVFQYSCIDLYDIFSIRVETEGLQAVNTIDELRHTNPELIPSDSIVLLGYNAPGDKPLIQYYWDSVSNDADNGGSVIKVDDISLGRWKFVPNQFEECDVRHFGAFPAMSYNQVSPSQSYSIQTAASMGGKLFFPKSKFGTGYYRINETMSNVVFDKATVILIPDGRDIVIGTYRNSENVTIGQTDGYYGNVTIEGDRLHYNCVNTYGGSTKRMDCVSFTPKEKFTFDYGSTITDDITLSNVEVYVNQDAKTQESTVTFDNCEVSGSITASFDAEFIECDISGDMFTSSNMLNTCYFTNCYSTADKWYDVNKYVTFWSKNGGDVLDLMGKSITRSFDLSPRNVVIKNAICGNNIFISIGSAISNIQIENSNVKLSLGSGGSRNVDISCINSTVGLLGNTWNRLKLDNSTFTITTNIAFPSVTDIESSNSVINTQNASATLHIRNICKIVHTSIDMSLNTTNANMIIVKDNIINEAITSRNIILSNNQINANITTFDNNGIIDFTIDGNIFANGTHTILSQTANAVVIGKWVNNVSYLPEHFIVIDRTNINLNELAHNYTYEGNSGPNVLQRYVKATNVITVSNSSAIPTGNTMIYPTSTTSGNSIVPYMCPSNIIYETRAEEPHFHARTKTIAQGFTWLMNISFFSVGITGIDFTGTCTVKAHRYTSDKKPTSVIWANRSNYLIGTTGYCSSDEKVRDEWVSSTPTNDMAATLLFNSGYSWYWNGWEHSPILFGVVNNAYTYIDMELSMDRI